MKSVAKVLTIFFLVVAAFIGLFLINTEKLFDQKLTIPSPEPPLQIRGSIPYWDQDAAVATLKKNASSFNQISLFWYWLDSDLSIKKYQYAQEDKSIIDFAHAHNIKVSAVLTNLPDSETAGWDSSRVELLLGSEQARSRHIDQIERKLSEFGFDGISIDYEKVSSSAKESFSSFIKELSEKLHEKNRFVGVALHPRTGNAIQAESIGFFQDWQVLAASADQLYIMAYDEHWDTGAAGPIASTPWVEKIVAYAESLKLPKAKLFLGIPLYGYSWNKDEEVAGTGLTFEGINKLLAETGSKSLWDDEAKSPYFKYKKDGKNYEVWYENTQSVQEKIALANTAGFGGVTFWRLGGEDPQIWPALKSYK